MEADTESLRSAAPQWSLAGDKQLLGVLQNIHERLVSRCQETNKKLGEMTAALDDASIDLQNVNNKFMALSNSQFIESRVYDDDADVATPVEQPKEPPKVEPMSEIEKIKIGLKVLEDMHEPLQILDSDSETDSEEEISRMVLKPKDLYADRPLPYIIGSYSWQSKWHAGLLPEDSDTDSSVKREPWEREEYSESDTEITKPNKDQESISSSEGFGSDQVTPNQSVPVPKSQASVANELARRLRGELPEPESQPEEEYISPPPAVTKVYRPEKPAPGNIFLDEPPPLDQSYQSSDEDDIFAELRKNQPYSQTNKLQSNVTEELFGEKQSGDDIFSDFREPPPPVSQKSTLFSETSEPELFAEQPPPLPTQDTTDSNVKKPIGGVSLFGTKGTESIGAAILKRNQRQSSSDDDVSDDTSTSQKDKEKDIFDHLFAKSEKEQRKNEKKIEKEPVKEVKVDKKVDLFSDNIFDDIDDIFTSNIPKVPIKTAEKNQKSLFDDDDDLFSNVAVAKTTNDTVKDKKDVKKSIFDSDDDLFTDKVEKNIPSKDTNNFKDKVSEIKKDESVKNDNKKSIFDSDDELFGNETNKLDVSHVKKREVKNALDNKSVNESTEVVKSNVKTKSIFDDSDSDIFSDNADTKEIPGNNLKEENSNLHSEKTEINSHKVDKLKETTPVLETKKSSLFDDDEDELFKTENKNIEKNANKISKEPDSSNQSVYPESKEQNTKSIFEDKLEPQTVVNDGNLFSSVREKKIEKPKKSLFDDDSEDDIFNDKSKPITKQKDDKANEVISKGIFDDDDDVFKGSVNATAQEEILKNEIKVEILEEIKDEIKNEIKDEVITELKVDLLVDKNKQGVDAVEKTLETTKLFEKSEIDDDDLSKHSTTKNVTANDKIDSTKKSILFDDLEDELFSNIPKTKETSVSKVDETKFPEKVQPMPEATESENHETKTSTEIRVNRRDIEKPTVLQEEKEPVFDKPAIFSDIFTEPPEFEKPKEPKKSKNVNALFDDDSDDEALFFKKTDPTLDEKPEFDSSSTENRLIGIFQDEPPALDIDFVQKPYVKSKENSTAVADSKHELFDEKSVVDKLTSKDRIDANITEKHTLLQKEVIKTPESSDKDILKTDITPKRGSDRTDAPKAIGKLKSMNFNINVNALLPGASPKKGKPAEQTDGNTQTKSSEDIRVKTDNQEIEKNDEPKIVKSISFEGKPESQVLDNKLSKERAKIQVKRRPSTRRARKEAVRKSGIDFGDDSTDNSSSIDDHPKDKTQYVKENENKVKQDVEEPAKSDDNKVSLSNEDTVDRIEVVKKTSIAEGAKKLVRDDEKNIFDTIDLDKEITDNSKENNVETLESSTALPKDEFVENESQVNTNKTISKDHTSPKPEVTTKTVYILNDEDIFNIEKPKKVLNIVDDEPGISTLGKVYKEPKKTFDSESDDDLFKGVTTKSKDKENYKNSEILKAQNENTTVLQDDTIDSDDNLFKTKPENKKVNIFADKERSTHENVFETKTTVDKKDLEDKTPKSQNINKDKTNIFDLDDDEDLFLNKSKNNDVFKKEVKKVDVKASLFGDDDDEDDLFGGSSKKSIDVPSSSQSARAKEVVTKSTEPVFEDPLSLLGGDDD